MSVANFRILPLLMALGLVASCTVDRSAVDEDLFTCATDAECGDGWGCLRAQPVTADFCAPLCGAAPCDGVCTGGDDPKCLRACRINPDGTASECPGDDFECIRTSARRSDGVCYPIEPCEAHSDCAENEFCPSESFRAQDPDSSFRYDRSYCQPVAPVSEQCPAGYKRLGAPDQPALCVIPCDVLAPECPPASGCLTAIQRQDAFGPFCFQSFGVSCESDANCFVGECLDTGTAQGKLCTTTCGDAERLAGGCGPLTPSLLGDLLRLECDSSAPSGDGTGLCTTKYMIFAACVPGANSATPCADGLSCEAFRFESPDGTVEENLCTKRCEEAEDCNTPYRPNFTNYVCQNNLCVIGPPPE